MTPTESKTLRSVVLAPDELRYLRGLAHIDVLRKQRENDTTEAGRKWRPIAESSCRRLMVATSLDLESEAQSIWAAQALLAELSEVAAGVPQYLGDRRLEKALAEVERELERARWIV